MTIIYKISTMKSKQYNQKNAIKIVSCDDFYSLIHPFYLLHHTLSLGITVSCIVRAYRRVEECVAEFKNVSSKFFIEAEEKLGAS
jgi:hypothetical protein